MSPYPAAALESGAGTTVDINSRSKKSVANVSVSAWPPSDQPRSRPSRRTTTFLRHLCVTSRQTGRGGTGRSE